MDELYFKGRYRIPSARLAEWNYANEGFYFITICTKNKGLFFGDVVGANGNSDAVVELSDIGKIAKKYWLEIPKYFPHTELDIFEIMPNHIHGIIHIKRNTTDQPSANKKRQFGPLQKGSISSIINQYKGCVKKWCNKNDSEYFAWQTRFHDRIIRNQEELDRIRRYIIKNPERWDSDRNNPKNF